MGLFGFKTASATMPVPAGAVKSVAQLTVDHVKFSIGVTAGGQESLHRTREAVFGKLQKAYKEIAGNHEQKIAGIRRDLDSVVSKLFSDVSSIYQGFVLGLGNESLKYPEAKGWDALHRPQIRDADLHNMLEVLNNPKKAVIPQRG